MKMMAGRSRVAAVPDCQGTETEFLGCRTFSFKIGRVLDKPGQVGHPGQEPGYTSRGRPWEGAWAALFVQRDSMDVIQSGKPSRPFCMETETPVLWGFFWQVTQPPLDLSFLICGKSWLHQTMLDSGTLRHSLLCSIDRKGPSWGSEQRNNMMNFLGKINLAVVDKINCSKERSEEDRQAIVTI